jgi:hypothetical protein
LGAQLLLQQRQAGASGLSWVASKKGIPMRIMRSNALQAGDGEYGRRTKVLVTLKVAMSLYPSDF